VEKNAQTFSLLQQFYKKNAQSNNRPIGENSPNLVTPNVSERAKNVAFDVLNTF
jgi:hypothetical protein